MGAELLLLSALLLIPVDNFMLMLYTSYTHDRCAGLGGRGERGAILTREGAAF